MEYFESSEGVYSVETAYNGMFLASEIIKRNYQRLAPCLQSILNTGKNIRASSQDRNASITTVRNGVEQVENGFIDISLLNTPILSIFTVKFTHELTNENRRILEGNSINSNGITIQNISRPIEYVTSGGLKRIGFILNGDLSEETDFTLIELNQ